MYQVIDSQTKQLMGVFKTRKAASRKADRLDLEYGAVRYYVQYATHSVLDVLDIYS